MRVRFGRVLAGVGIAALGFGFTVSRSPLASATPANAVTWADANFNGYATGSEAYLAALPGTTTVADLQQGFSGATTASKGLTNPIYSEYNAVVQPAESSSAGDKAYGGGSGFELGVATKLSTTDQNQIKEAGAASQVAPPNKAPVTLSHAVSVPSVASASLLTGEGAAVYDPVVCPLGQPISFGLGNAANATFATPISSSVPAGSSVSTAGAAEAAQSTSETYLSSNGDGSFGLSTRATDTIAPVNVSVGTTLKVQILVQSTGGIDDPVSLTAKTTGESTGASITFSSDDLLKVNLIAGGTTTNVITVPLTAIGKGGLHIPLSTAALGTSLTTLDGTVSGLASTLPAVGPTVSTVLTQSAVTGLLTTLGTTASKITNSVATVDLGSLDIDAYPHVIGQAATDPATAVGGTSAAGDLDLIHLDLQPTVTVGSSVTETLPTIANFAVGHLETEANLTNPILCSLPVIKTADPTAVTAGQNFTYNIDVPDPAKIDLIDCNLDDITVTDTITDYQGMPTFTVDSATDTANGAAGHIDQISPNKATVTWTGLSYTVAQTGQPPNPPIPLSIALTVPTTSPSGVITDTVVAQGTAEDCHGGAAVAVLGSAAASTDAAALGADGASLTGSYTLNAPSVSPQSTTATTGPSTASKTLPFTGAMGGFWQPVGGLVALGLGAGGLGLARRARRLQQD